MTSITQAGPAVTAGPAAPQTPARRTPRRHPQAARDRSLRRPRAPRLPRLRDPPGRARRRLQLLQLERPRPARALHRPRQLHRARSATRSSSSRSATTSRSSCSSLLIQGPIAIIVALLLNRRMRGRTFIRAAIFVPYVLVGGHRRSVVEAAALAARRRQRLPRVDRARRARPAVARQPGHRALGDVRHPHLEVPRLRDPAHARRTPGRARGALGGRRDRRRQLVEDPVAHHAAAARRRPSASGRSCRSSARCSCSTWCGSPPRAVRSAPPARWRPT